MSSVQDNMQSFSAGTRQKFTPEYLAKQLPLFQERIPRATLVRRVGNGELEREREREREL